MRGGEWANTAQFAIGTELLASSCEDFMTVCLMPYIPYDAVFRGVEDIMQGYGNLCHAKTRSQMARIDGKLLYDVLS